MKKETWKTVFQIVLSISTAIAASLGVTSCMSENCTRNLELNKLPKKEGTSPFPPFLYYLE